MDTRLTHYIALSYLSNEDKYLIQHRQTKLQIKVRPEIYIELVKHSIVNEEG